LSHDTPPLGAGETSFGKLWKANEGTPWKMGKVSKMESFKTSLNGISGQLVRYFIDDMEVKKFLPDDKSRSRYFINKATWNWVLIIDYKEESNSKYYFLDKNPDDIEKEEIILEVETKNICR
jgi:hypothetical protein